MKTMLGKNHAVANVMNAARTIPAAFMATALLTATVHAQQVLYWGGGNVNIPDNTALPTPAQMLNMTGVWNTTTRNWSVDPHGTRYVAWENGVDKVAVFSSSTISVNPATTVKLEDDIVLNKVRVVRNYLGTADGLNMGMIMFTSADGTTYLPSLPQPARTLTLTGVRPGIEARGQPGSSNFWFVRSVELVAPNGFFFEGGTRICIYRTTPANRVHGTVTTTEGQDYYSIQLNGEGAMTNVTEFIHYSRGERPGGFLVNMDNANGIQIGRNAIIRLYGGSGFYMNGANGTSIMNEFDRVVLEGAGFFDLRGYCGTFRAVNGIERGRDGIATLFLDDASTNAAPPDSPGDFRARFEAQNNVDAGVLLPWVFENLSRPVMLNPATRRFERMAVVDVPANYAQWDSNGCYRVTAGGALASSTYVKSLGFYNPPATTTVTIPANESLILGSGHLSAYLNTTADVVITGGSVTSGTNKLYIMAGTITLAGSVNPKKSILHMNSELAGDMDVILATNGSGAILSLGGPENNTYTGTTFVNGIGLFTFYVLGGLASNDRYSVVRLNKSGGALAIPGNLVITPGAGLEVQSANAINPAAEITIRDGGVLMVANNVTQHFNGLVTLENAAVRGSGLDFAAPGFGLVFADGGRLENFRPNGDATFNLFTDVSYPATASHPAAITGNWPYSGTTPSPFGLRRMYLTPAGAPSPRTFDVNASGGLEPGIPELLVDFPLASHNGTPANLVKTGGGVMELRQFSGYFHGSATVLDGELWLNGPYATQSVMTAAAAGTALTLSTNAGLLFTQPVRLPGSATEAWISGLTGANAATLTSANGNGNYTFLACGSLGVADCVATNKGVLAGTGGTGGSVYVHTGGTLHPGTPAQPGGKLGVGGNLAFGNGGVWRVNITGEETCATVHIGGGISLEGGRLDPVFLFGDPETRPKSMWTIATFEGAATGKLTVPAGTRTVIKGKKLLFYNDVPGTLLMVR